MTLRDEFAAAAIEIFNAFEDFVIDAHYIQGTSAYEAGGNLSATDVQHPIRLIRDESRITITLGGDIPYDSIKYVMINSELPITPKAKDRVLIGTDTKAILALDTDPGGIVTTLYVEG